MEDKYHAYLRKQVDMYGAFEESSREQVRYAVIDLVAWLEVNDTADIMALDFANFDERLGVLQRARETNNTDRDNYFAARQALSEYEHIMGR
jgi:hypothetical protein